MEVWVGLEVWVELEHRTLVAYSSLEHADVIETVTVTIVGTKTTGNLPERGMCVFTVACMHT